MSKFNQISSNTIVLMMLILWAFHYDILKGQTIPLESQRAEIIQSIGLNNVRITYYRPNAKGRKIFGSLVEYNKIWRTGANYSTLIETKDTMMVGAERLTLLPGKYALFTIPDKDKWVIIFNSNIKLWGAFGYKEEEDVLRLAVKPASYSEYTETFTIEFADVLNDAANLCLRWENTEVKIPVFFNVFNKVFSRLEVELNDNLSSDASKYRNAATYLLSEKKEQKTALNWANRATELDSTWINHWLLAEIQAWAGDYTLAVKYGELALSGATKPEQINFFPYQKVYEGKLDEWRKMIR